MEFIQEKTSDKAVAHFLSIAADREISLVWDRYEGQLPECGFCESGLSCRDCLQGPCISHPFRDRNKQGVCGKDKDLLAVQSLLRLAIKGTMARLDQLAEFAGDIESGSAAVKIKSQTEDLTREARALLENGAPKLLAELPKTLVDRWKDMGICPEGIARDLFKASQRLEGGITDAEYTLLWAFKSSLLGFMAQVLYRKLKIGVFGHTEPTRLEVNVGVLQNEAPNLLLYGNVSPLLKLKIAQEAEKKNVGVMGVCTDPLLPPYRFFPVTNYGSQEIPLMTGAVDLIVAGDQFVNPSLVDIAKEWSVTLIPADGLNRNQDLERFAEQIVEQTQKAFDIRREIPRDIPKISESAFFGYSSGNMDVKKVVAALNEGKIKGIAIFAGSNNVKYKQDYEFAAAASEFLKNDILCVSEGEASVSLAKYGFLNPVQRQTHCGRNLQDFLSSLGDNTPPILDWETTDFLSALAEVEKKALNQYPITACFSEANRTAEVSQALWTVAMGVSTYFWPCLPVTGSPKTVKALSAFCDDKFGAKLHVITQKMAPRMKAELFLKELQKPSSLSGKSW